jgi:hypothetical protein
VFKRSFGALLHERPLLALADIHPADPTGRYQSAVAL